MDQLIVQILPILLAITIHEYAHGWAAMKLGDPTAKSLGRLTLNPLAHVDPVGTVLFPLIQVIFPPHRVFFGWAKPVPVNPVYFKNPRRDMAWVAIAGPASNLLQLLVAAMCIRLFLFIDPSLDYAVQYGAQTAMQKVLVPLLLMCTYALAINAVLMVFNLIPIPPLDGSRILFAVLPANLAQEYAKLERYGMLIVLGLIILAPAGALWVLVSPVVDLAYILAGIH